MKLIIPENYDPVLTVRETQEAIKYIRDTFQYEFGKELNLSRISAPLYVTQSSGLNDNLNGTEKPVSFTMKELHMSINGTGKKSFLKMNVPNKH